MTTPIERLKHHVTGAIKRGEAETIVEQPARVTSYRTTRVQIIGTIAGAIWQPNCICSKEIAYTVNIDGETWPTSNTIEPETLREALCTITADGDFQNCGLVDGAIIKVIRTNASGTKRVRRWTIRFACWATDDMLSEVDAAELTDDAS